MNRTLVTIQSGALTGMVGELLDTNKVLVSGKVFNMNESDYKPANYPEIFDTFIKGQRIKHDSKLNLVLENGCKFHVVNSETSEVEILDAENNILYKGLTI